MSESETERLDRVAASVVTGGLIVGLGAVGGWFSGQFETVGAPNTTLTGPAVSAVELVGLALFFAFVLYLFTRLPRSSLGGD